MQAVKGLYDGEKVQSLENSGDLKPREVIVTILEKENDIGILREYAADVEAFDFWKEEEDLYQDYLNKRNVNG